ncbi:MFS transporter [Halomonas organivorans]|uniref:CP family cyanate transporter-like MFS transporter n=1 Tax=Halomonas organivorans TaxID=257772 RepID=A0A7W5BWZ6_9GAMM|nr:MFS transporter [Halomonas organivorans]MBB3140680.1 CP family cyanate transporter-like MFS transporter [Halomonas organivorans]
MTTPSLDVRRDGAAHPVVFIALMVLVGLNLRPALSSLAPLLPRIEADTGMPLLAIGALTTLPVLCLGLFAPLAPWLSRRVGPERTLSLALLVLALGLGLRGLATPAWLFAGTLLVGAGIGVAGTLLPALVKRELPASADVMTGVYTMALCLGGALGAGLSIPLAGVLGGWPVALTSWAALAALGLIAWQALMPTPAQRPPAPPRSGNTRALLTQPLAWQVTLYMGCQSSLAYIVFGWLPTLLVERGYGEAEAGWLMGVSVMVQLGSALAAPWLARLGRDQRPALILVLSLIGAGFWVLLQGPAEWRWAGVVLLGLGQGGGFSLALSLIVLRTADARLAGKLSGMVQGGGYALASLGPLGIGVMLDLELGLTGITLALLAVVAAAMAFALLAGRNRRLINDEAGRLVVR